MNMNDYVDVAERIAQLKEAYPEASLQPYNPNKPSLSSIPRRSTRACSTVCNLWEEGHPNKSARIRVRVRVRARARARGVG